MGNSSSDFEEQFFKLYSFIATLPHPHFKTVRIYRKLRHNFNHIMIADLPLPHPPLRAALLDRLALIRRFQNRFTVQLEYFHLLEQHAFECGSPQIRLYIDYYNYTLMDYLSALRMKRQALAVDELVLVVQSLAEGILTLRKMGMDSYRITLSSIFLVVEEGIVILNPVYLLYDSLSLYHARALHSLTQEFEVLGARAGEAGEVEARQKAQLRSLVLELTRYLSQQCLPQSQGLLRALDSCSSLQEVCGVFVSGIDELNVQQFGESSDESPPLY